MQAIIMAAGEGTRLKEKTKNIPKALIKVQGKELLLYVLDFLNKDLINEIIIVVGYKNNKIKNFINSIKYPKKITIVENKNFKKGNILSLLCGLPYIYDDFILMNVDHIYYHPKIFEIVTSDIRGITGICDFDRKLDDDDMKILIKNNQIIKINKKLKIYNGGYVGMTIIPKNKLDIYKKTAHILAQKYNGNVHVEEILQILANSGEAIYFKDISNLGWVEVDTLEDLKYAEAILQKIKTVGEKEI